MRKLLSARNPINILACGPPEFRPVYRFDYIRVHQCSSVVILCPRNFPDVVMLDLTVRGGKGGKQALEEIRQLDPQARIIVCSGYTDDAILADRDQHSIAGSIAKPFLSKDLARELARVMQAP